jgi:HSP20 family molecular chaperone IbpA
MFDVPVQEVPKGKAIPPAWLDKLVNFTEQVRHKAFDLFEESARPLGRDVVSHYELLESAYYVDVCIAIPGFDVDEIGIVALHDSLLVRAAAKTAIDKRQPLFRRIPMPAEIDVTRIKANLDKGLLRIAARKVEDGEICKAACGRCRATKGASQCQ